MTRCPKHTTPHPKCLRCQADPRNLPPTSDAAEAFRRMNLYGSATIEIPLARRSAFADALERTGLVNARPCRSHQDADEKPGTHERECTPVRRTDSKPSPDGAPKERFG